MSNMFLEDKRVHCLSGLGQIEATEYLDLVNQVYRESGGIPGQRAPLKTKTGINSNERTDAPRIAVVDRRLQCGRTLHPVDDRKRGCRQAPKQPCELVICSAFTRLFEDVSAHNRSNHDRRQNRTPTDVINHPLSNVDPGLRF